jgi:hypothetical protein
MYCKRLNVNSIFDVRFFLSGATGLVYEVIWVRLTGHDSFSLNDVCSYNEKRNEPNGDPI